MPENDSFTPPRWLRPAFAQTVFASARVRAVGVNPMVQASRELIVTSRDGVRLKGFLSAKPCPSRGLVVLLHGWEGSSDSTYILHTGKFLFENGYSVFRLNFRDHGDTHHLNEGMFRAVMLDEVADAVRYACSLAQGSPCFLMGFSLGGNFALRIARRCAVDPIERLHHVMAISPVIDPSRATDAIDKSPLLRAYFLRKWRRSLLRKQELFPHLYDFTWIVRQKTVRSMTDALFETYRPGYGTEEYFRAYAVADRDLEGVILPTTIVMAEDDPAIPAGDFERLVLGPGVTLVMHEFGGHNGFLEGVFSPTWYEKKALTLFSESPADAWRPPGTLRP